MSFFNELKRRLFFKVGVSYLAGSWLVIQAVDTAALLMDYPAILVRGFAFMLGLSFPIIMLMLWVYEITHKTRGWEDFDIPETTKAGRMFYPVIFVVLFLSAALLLVDLFLLETPAVAHTKAGPASVAVHLRVTPVA